MCGLAYVRRLDKKPAYKSLWKRYKHQRERGQSGFGYVAIGAQCTTRRTEGEKEIERHLAKETSHEILFHHRLPTSTPNLAEMAHPIEIRNALLKYTYLVAHNGIVTNDEELKQEYERLGFQYTTAMAKKYVTREKTYKADMWNDSETFAISLALAIEGKKKKVEARGSSAFIALQVDRKNAPLALYFGRNDGNPLYSNQQKGVLISLTSEGSGVLITPHTLYRYDYKANATTEKEMEVGNKDYNYYIPSYYNTQSIGFQNEYVNDLEEDDFDDWYLQLLDEKRELEETLRIARINGDWDTEIDTKQELQHIQDTINEYNPHRLPIRTHY